MPRGRQREPATTPLCGAVQLIPSRRLPTGSWAERRRPNERARMDPGPKTGHHHPGRRSSDLGGGGQRQDRCADRTGVDPHHRPGAPGGYRPAAYCDLLQCRGGGNAAENRGPAVRANGAGAGKRRAAAAEPPAGQRRDLHPPCLLLPAHPGEFPGAGAARRYGPGPGWGGRAFAGGGAGAAAG